VGKKWHCLFAIIFMAEFETNLIRQSNNKIVTNGDIILMVFPPFATEEKYGYLIIGQANKFQPTTKFKPKMRTK